MWGLCVIAGAISELLTPARYSFRISAAYTDAVAGRPSRFSFSRACAMPARVRSCRISRWKAAKTARMAAIARPPDRCRQIQRLGQRYETHAEIFQFLEGTQ